MIVSINQTLRLPGRNKDFHQTKKAPIIRRHNSIHRTERKISADKTKPTNLKNEQIFTHIKEYKLMQKKKSNMKKKITTKNKTKLLIESICIFGYSLNCTT